MRFLIDVQLPRPLVSALRREAHLADYASNLLPATASDRAIWDVAVEVGATIITKDEDFVDLVRRRIDPISVVWLRCGNIYNPDLIALVPRNLPDIVAALERGERLIEIR